jgi:hypothetical protein
MVYSITVNGVTTYYAAKVDGSSVGKPGADERAWLSSLYPGIQFPGPATGGTNGDHLSLTMPAGAVGVKAFAADGNFGTLPPGTSTISPSGTPPGLEYLEVGFTGDTVHFYKGY